MGHVQVGDAEDKRHPAGRDGSENVTAVSNSSFDGLHTHTFTHLGGTSQDLLPVPHQHAAHPGYAEQAPYQVEYRRVDFWSA